MPIELVLELVAFTVLMGLSAFFSSSETALFSLNRLQLEQMRRDGTSNTTLVERLLSQPRQLIVTILIGNELVNVSASVISAAIVIRVLGSESKWINLLIMVPLLLLVGEITPKTLAIRNNVAFASFQSRFIDLFARLISPLRWLVRHISDFFTTLIVGQERSRANIVTEDMVRSLADEAVGDGVLDSEEALYINRIFDFGDKILRDIMTPRSRVLSLPETASLEEAALAYRRTSHTKVPVHGANRGLVVGVLYARDLLELDVDSEGSERGARSVAEVMREAYFVPETKSVADLFYTFRKRKLSLALTVDEYGGVTGLVTIEDLLECIFGEIISPSELRHEGALKAEKLGERGHRIDGAMRVEQFNRLFGCNLDMEAAETVGGLLLHAFGELPPAHSRLVIDDHEFEVEAMAGQRIAQVIVRPVAAPGEAAGPAEAGDGDPAASAADPDPGPGGTGG